MITLVLVEKKMYDNSTYWEQGDTERKTGNTEEAIRLFDEAR